VTQTGPGEPADLVALCRAEHPRLVGALTIQVGDRAVAEELAQEALVRTWQRWDQVREMDNPTAWVFRVAFNLATSSLRRRGAERRARARVGAPTTTPDDGGTWGDRLAVRQAVAALPPRQRAALVLRTWVDLPVDDVAAVLGCAPGTVKSLTHQAVRSLRVALGDALDDADDAVAAEDAADGPDTIPGVARA
jgi:RNA polymerase sigma-70 factor (sigma-E family)